MNHFVGTVAWMALASAVWAQEPARVTLYCTSLRFETGTGGPGQAASLALTSDPNLVEVNGEVSAFYDPTLPSHGAFFRLEDPAFPDSIFGRIAFDTPEPVDDNGDAFDDFFQSTQAVAATTRGLFETVVDVGSVTATWSRGPGSSTGTCRLQMVGEAFGELPEFTHTFQLLEYKGTLAYTTSSNAINGVLQLEQTQNDSGKLGGPIVFTRNATNRFGLLNLATGVLTNSAGESLAFQPSEVTWDDVSKTNYYGFLSFADGDPSTGTVDYWDWVLSIDDTNDANGNGIPDLSDDPAGVAKELRVGLTRSGGRLLLSLAGQPSATYDLEESASLAPAEWRKSMSITLTNAAQTVPIALPSSPTMFWRLKRP
ncbi:MAG: hypothetical protein AB9869_35935 [Verrucomicrobiia bacterium]